MKRTYNLDADIVSIVRQEVEMGSAPSQDAFVEAAIRTLARELTEKREALRWREAALDPEFQAEAAGLEAGLASEEHAAWGGG